MASKRSKSGPGEAPQREHAQARGQAPAGRAPEDDPEALQEAALRLARRNAVGGFDNRLGRAADEDSIGQNPKHLEAPAGAGEGLRDQGRYGGQDAPMGAVGDDPPTTRDRVDTGREGVLAAGGGDGTRGTVELDRPAPLKAPPRESRDGAGADAAGAAGDDPLRPLTPEDDAAMVPRTRPRDDDRVGRPIAYGGTGRVARRGDLGTGRDDARIQDAVCERLAQLPDIDPTDVLVSVRDGRVTLDGMVPAQHMKDLLESRTRDVDGVEAVDDRVRVGSAPNEPMRTPGEAGRRHI